MKTKNKHQWIVIFFIFFLIFNSVQASAEKAFYKEISLSGIEHFSIKGAMSVDFKPGDEEKVELYIRKKHIHAFKIGTELIDGHKTFFIKDTTKPTDERGDVKPVAHAIFTIKKLSSITANDAQLLTINHVKSDFLNINAMGFSNIILKNVNIELAKFYLRHSALLKVEDAFINDFSLYQKGQSKVAIDGLESTNLRVDLRDHSRLSSQNILTEYLHAFGTFKTHLYVKENSVINTAYLSGSVDVQMDLTAADIKVVNGNFSNQAKVNIGDVEMLSVYVRNNVKVQYAGTPILNNTSEHKSTITKYDIEKVDIDE